MFNKEYSFKGIHADYVNRLTGYIDKTNNQKIFNRNLDVYIYAPIVGLVYGRKAIAESSTTNATKIFTEQLLNEQQRITFNYRLVMLVDGIGKLSAEERIDRAFRYDRDDEKRKTGDEIYDQYVLGGVEVLYDKIINGKNELDDILTNMFNFLSEYNERYNTLIDSNDIYELCKLARD